jgi:hypothetical protein
MTTIVTVFAILIRKVMTCTKPLIWCVDLMICPKLLQLRRPGFYRLEEGLMDHKSQTQGLQSYLPNIHWPSKIDIKKVDQCS